MKNKPITKQELIARILDNSVYLPESTMRLNVADQLHKLSRSTLAGLLTIITCKLSRTTLEDVLKG